MSSPVLIQPGDALERFRAIDPRESFLVQAPAGSGKTELLIQRYLKLLSIVEKPERIQAITFTRKAAGEMRERIIHALERARANGTPDEPHERATHELACAALARDRELGWGLLENPTRMKLQTIDSLCGGIVTQMPWLARQGRLLEVIEDATPLYLSAAQRTVMMVEHDGRHREHLERILLHLDNNAGKVAKLITAMLSTRDQWLELAVGIGDQSRERFEHALESVVDDGREAVKRLLPQDLRTLLPDLFGNDWSAMADAFLTVRGKWRKKPGTVYAALLPQLSEVPGLREALHFIRSLPPLRYTDAQWQITRSIFECLKLAVAQLRLVFQDAGHVDFCEISQAARYALGHAEDPTELALKLDARIEHLLIDEFQDTSLTQFALAERLIEGWEPSDGRTIFLVGDPMQSIYRFRQAEVGLFLGTRDKGIGSANPRSLVLQANYRSVPGIVEWVNRVFASVFPALSDPETGAISYSPSQATKPDAETAVHFHPFAEKQEVREAETVVSLIRQARREDPEGTVAILVRARTHLPAIVDQLKNASLSFRAVEIDELSERAVVRDLLSLTRALLHPGDRLSWLAILRAPWCGLTLADLHALAATDQRAFIYDLLRGDLSALTRDGRQRTARFMGVIEAAFASRGRVPLRTWVERTWQDLGGPSCAEDPAASQDAADYLDLLEREQSGCDLPDFDAFAGRVGKLKAQADPTANEWLQVMTIHKAKGLQFDTVILPGLGRQARRDDSRMFLFHRGLVAPIKESAAEFDPIYAYLAELEKRRGKHEIVRQLYVAATRARKSLHLMGSVKVYTKGVKPISGSLLSALWAGMTIEERQLFIDQAAIPPAGSSQAKPQPPLRRLPEGWVAPPPPKPLEITASGPEINELEQPTFEWVGDSLRYAGTVVHELLQRLAKTGLTQIDPAVVRRALSQLGVPPAELDRAAVQVEAAISRTLSSPKGRWILATHRQARSEMSVAGVVDGKIVRGTVDRTFIDDRGIRWVIDFKTSAHQGGGVAEFLDEQQRRYRAQMERYARLLAPMGQPVRLGLYFPLLDKWREWAMEWSEWLWATD